MKITENQSSEQTILIDLSKRNHDPMIDNIQNDLKFTSKRLKLKGWKITINRESLTEDLLFKFQILILLMPKSKYTDLEFSSMKNYLEHQGGKILILLEEGGERISSININYFIEEYGTSVNNDKVIRASFYKYFNPKEVLIEDGVINRSLTQYASQSNLMDTITNIVSNGHHFNQPVPSLAYLYPMGGTLNVVRPSIPVLSTGKTSFPPCRPTCSFYEHQSPNGGKMIVFGSGYAFTDRYIQKEHNTVLLDIFLAYLTDETFKPNMIDSLNPEVNDYQAVPDLEILCNQPMLYLEESEELPMDYTSLFSKKIKHITNQSLAKINDIFQELQIEKRTLQVIKPHFETPLPGLQPAVYMPVFRAHTKPELELYDLDQEFASIQSKLTKLANKCNNGDVEYFIRECGLTLGLNVNYKENVCKNILYSVAEKIVTFKKINNE